MNHQLIEINKLSKSPQNVRRTIAKGADDEMKASILAHGLMQNLVVTEGEDGTFRVIEGARRLQALKSLQQDGKLPEWHTVPCQIVDEETALEKSLAANTVRLPMHPADEFEAFAKLAKDETPEQIGQRFGKIAKYVEQRLKLGNADPKLLKEYRAENLTLECLMAFTITDDRKRQMKVYRSLKDSRSLNPRAIRAALTDTMAEASSKLAKFVGLDAYREAGGTTQSDLFSDAVYLENPQLLNDLAAQKLDATKRELEAENWGWIEISVERDYAALSNCGHIHPQPGDVPAELEAARDAIDHELAELERQIEDGNDDAPIDDAYTADPRRAKLQDELAEIDGKIDALAAYDPEHVKIAGCYVSINHDGSPRIEKGLVKKQDRKRLTKAGDAKEKKPKGIPATLTRSLEAERLQISQAEMAKNRLVALDLLIFTATSDAFSAGCDGLDVQFREHDPAVKEPTAAGHAVKATRKALPLAWLKLKTEAQQFLAFSNLSDKQKLDLLAWCVAGSLKPQLATGREATAYEMALSLTGAEVASYWRPTAANYLGRITRDQLLDLSRTVISDEWAQYRHRDKKSHLAAQLERAFAEPEKHASTPEQLERLTHWLPDGMAFTATAAKPKAKKKNARKAA
jgi:ParB family transcriptional regulator, chromosome partitioning protein